MPTEELEHELRRAFTRAAADFRDPEQAGQRLLQRDYRPGHDHRRLAVSITSVTAAATVALGLGLAGTFGSAPAHGTGTIQTTAFTLVEHANGTATLTINQKVLFEPSVLQSDLQADGIPAVVTTGSFCSSDPAPAGFDQVVTFETSQPSITINPAAMPAGTELSFGNFQLSRERFQTVVGLIDMNSHACTSTPTAALTHGAGLVVGRAASPAKAGS
jgi:hypothetical protein